MLVVSCLRALSEQPVTLVMLIYDRTAVALNTMAGILLSLDHKVLVLLLKDNGLRRFIGGRRVRKGCSYA